MKKITHSVGGDRRSQHQRQEHGACALHIRRLRQWHGERGISQGDLAKLTGISNRVLHTYETRRTLPQVFNRLLLIASVLKVSIEALVDPRIINQIGGAVEERRRALKEQARRKRTKEGYDN